MATLERTRISSQRQPSTTTQQWTTQNGGQTTTTKVSNWSSGVKTYGGAQRVSTIRTSGAPIRTSTTRVTSHNAPVTRSYGTTRHQGAHVVSVTEHPENSYVVSEGRRVGDGKFVSQTIQEGGSELIRIDEGKHIIIDNKPAERTIKRADLTGIEEEAVIIEEIEEVPVEVIIEHKIPKTTYVDVPYDVIERVPKTRIIEKEIIVKKIKEVPYEKVIEVPVERIVEVPVETIEEVYIDVPIEKRVPYETIVHNEIPVYRDNVIYSDETQVIDVRDLARYRNDPNVVRVDPTDVRIHERVVTREVDDVRVNTIVDVVQEPVYHYTENLVEVPIDAPYTVIDEVAVLNSKNTNKVVVNTIENRVDQPYEVVNEQANLNINSIGKTVTNVIDVKVEEPYTVERVNEVATLNSRQQGHEVVNTIHNKVYNYDTIKRQVQVPVDRHIPLTEARTQTFEVRQGQPQQKRPEIFVQDVEYHIKQERPAPRYNDIVITVPRVNQRVNEHQVDVEVPCKVLIEQPVAVVKEITVDVVNTIEKANYQEKLTEKTVPFDVVIEREVEEVEEEYYDVDVEKIIEVPVKITRRNPIEKNEYFENQINVSTTKIQPVQGREISNQTIEVPNQNLAARIRDMQSEISSLSANNQRLSSEYNSLRLDTSSLARYNDLLRKIAHSQSSLNQVESRKDVLIQDIQRLQGVQSQFGAGRVSTVEYVVPHPELNRLSSELSRLVQENNSLVSRVKTSAHY